MAGCAASDEGGLPAGGAHDARFVCPDGTAVGLSYPGTDAAVVQVGDRAAMELPRVISGSGARYSDGQNEVWEAKGMLRVTLADGTVYEDCVEN